MSLLQVQPRPPLPRGQARLVDVRALRSALERETTAELRFDTVSRALYSTDASVYRIEPLGVVLPRTQDDLVAIVRICARCACPLTMRGGGTSQSGQTIGDGIIVDTSKHLNRVLEVNVEERWARVELGPSQDRNCGEYQDTRYQEGSGARCHRPPIMNWRGPVVCLQVSLVARGPSQSAASRR